MPASLRFVCAVAVSLAVCPGLSWADLSRTEAPRAESTLTAQPLAQGQEQQQDTIFRRFSSPPRRAESRMRMFELPVALRPQTDADAEVDENVGIGYTVAFQPFNRVFASLGVDLARLRWVPTDPAVASADVKQLSVHQDLNFWLARRFVVGIGLGLGLLDALVVNTDGTFEHNLVPVIPVRLGLAVAFGDSVFVGLRVVASPFFSEDFVVGHSRLLLGLGWTY